MSLFIIYKNITHMELKYFLQKNKSTPVLGYTHTTIPGDIPGGSYFIDKKKFKIFMKYIMIMYL